MRPSRYENEESFHALNKSSTVISRLCFIVYLFLVFCAVSTAFLFLLSGNVDHFMIAAASITSACAIRYYGFEKLNFEQCEFELDSSFDMEIEDADFERWLQNLLAFEQSRDEDIWHRHEVRAKLVCESRQHPAYSQRMLEMGMKVPLWLR